MAASLCPKGTHRHGFPISNSKIPAWPALGRDRGDRQGHGHACTPCLRRSGFAQAGVALQRVGTDTIGMLASYDLR
jgi:hypothetical protein